MFPWGAALGATGSVLGSLLAPKGDPTHGDALNDFRWRLMSDLYHKGGLKGMFDFGGEQNPMLKQSFNTYFANLMSAPNTGSVDAANMARAAGMARLYGMNAMQGIGANAAARGFGGNNAFTQGGYGNMQALLAKALSGTAYDSAIQNQQNYLGRLGQANQLQLGLRSWLSGMKP